MRINKKFLILKLLLSLILVSACQSDNNAGNSTDGVNDDGKEKVVLKFWYPETGVVEEAINELIEQYEDSNNDVEIEYTAVPWAEYFQKLSVGYAGGTAPDVHGLGFGQLVYSVYQEQYMDLTDFIEKDNWDGADDFFPDLLEAGQWEGGQYGLLIPEVRPLIWRKDYFEEAGLDPEQPPQTYDEIFEYARKLKVVDENGQTQRAGMDINTENGEQDYYGLMLLHGEKEIYKENGDPLWDSEVSKKIVKDLVDLYKDGAIIASHQQQLEGSPFSNGEAAMTLANVEGTKELAKEIGYENLGFDRPPKGPNGGQTALMLGTFVTMNKSTNHADEAWDFIKFLFSPESLLHFSEKTGFAVPRQSLKDEYLDLSPENEIVYETLRDAKGYSPTEHWSLNMEKLRTALEESYYDVREFDEALDYYADEVRQELNLK